jgi:hypothetical protein
MKEKKTMNMQNGKGEKKQQQVCEYIELYTYIITVFCCLFIAALLMDGIPDISVEVLPSDDALNQNGNEICNVLLCL